jgi:hypothetical protein
VIIVTIEGDTAITATFIPSLGTVDPSYKIMLPLVNRR